MNLSMVFRAKDIVETDFLSMSKETTALEAARAMKTKKHGFVVIVTPEGRPEGIVTEWDYLSKLVAEGKDPSRVKLAELMSTNLVTVDAEEGTDQISQLMADKGIRRLLVTEDGKTIGVITAKTILANLKEYVNKVSTQVARLQPPRY